MIVCHFNHEHVPTKFNNFCYVSFGFLGKYRFILLSTPIISYPTSSVVNNQNNLLSFMLKEKDTESGQTKGFLQAIFHADNKTQ